MRRLNIYFCLDHLRKRGGAWVCRSNTQSIENWKRSIWLQMQQTTFENIFLCFTENEPWYFIQKGHLNEVASLIFCEKWWQYTTNLSSANLAWRVLNSARWLNLWAVFTVHTLFVYNAKTCLYNFDPLKPHFYMVKLGLTGVYIIFIISTQKNIDCGYSIEPPTMFCKDKWKNIRVFYLKIFSFLRWKFLCIWIGVFFYKMACIRLIICVLVFNVMLYYENTPIQIYWKFYHQKKKKKNCQIKKNSAETRKMYTLVNPEFHYIKVGLMGIKIM